MPRARRYSVRERLWEVEAIVDVDASSKYYLVRWAGTDKTGKPWELEWRHKHHLRRCGQLLQEFKEEREAAGYLVARNGAVTPSRDDDGLSGILEDSSNDLADEPLPPHSPCAASSLMVKETPAGILTPEVEAEPSVDLPCEAHPNPPTELEDIKQVWATNFSKTPWDDVLPFWIGREYLRQRHRIPPHAPNLCELLALARDPRPAFNLALVALFAHEPPRRSAALEACSELCERLRGALTSSHSLRTSKGAEDDVRALLRALEGCAG